MEENGIYQGNPAVKITERKIVKDNLMVTNLMIRQLYGHYDYDIELGKNKKVTILIGPNGYGKSTILKILNNLISCNLWYFNLIEFRHIMIQFSDGYNVHIQKNKAEESEVKDLRSRNISESIFILSKWEEGHDVVQSEFVLSTNYVLRKVRRSAIGYRTMDTMREIDIEDYLNRNYKFSDDDDLPEASKFLTSYLLNEKSIFVKEQRIQYEDVDGYSRKLINRYNVDKIAEDLDEILVDYQELFGAKCEEIDSAFVEKLLSDSNDGYSLNEYNKKAKVLESILKQFQKYGLAENLHLDFQYNDQYRKVLSHYIDDMEGKLNAYWGLFIRMSSLDGFLKSKDLANKHISVTKKGLVAFDTNGSVIPLRKLSSGEQNLIILYFFLLFKTSPGMLVCLDEPEISMHVAWQETMLADLKTIAKVLDVQIVVATHSIDLVNGNWDNCIDLFEAAKDNEDNQLQSEK